MAGGRGRYTWLAEEPLNPTLAQIGAGAAVVSALLLLIGQIFLVSAGKVPGETADMFKQMSSGDLDRLAYGAALGSGSGVGMLFLWPVLYRILRPGAPTWALLGLILASTGSALTIMGWGASQWVVPLGRAARAGMDPLALKGIADSLAAISGGIVQGSYVVLGAGLAALSVAILVTRLFPRAIGWFAVALAIILVMQAIIPQAGNLFVYVGVVWLFWLALIFNRAAVPARTGSLKRKD
ncbi:MAG: DUF4386 family protein [Dehalococcoidia bacterium]